MIKLDTYSPEMHQALNIHCAIGKYLDTFPGTLVISRDGTTLINEEGVPWTPDALSVSLRAFCQPGKYERRDDDGEMEWQQLPSLPRAVVRGYLQSPWAWTGIPSECSETGWDWVPMDRVSAEAAKPQVGRRIDGAPLFYRSKVNVVFGDSEGAKTWLCLLATAQELLSGNSVAYLDYEDGPEGIKNRLLLLGVPEDVVNDPVMFKYANPNGPIGQMLKSDRFCEDLCHCSLVVVDAMTEALSAAGLNSNSDVDVASWYNTFAKPMAALGPAVVLIDHTPKAADNKGQQVGSQMKKAAVDGVSLSVTNKQPFVPGQLGTSEVNVGKDRPSGVREASLDGKKFGMLTMDPSGPHTLRIELPERELTAEERAVALDYIVSDVWDSLELAGNKTTVDDIKKAYRARGHRSNNSDIEASIQRVRPSRSPLLPPIS